MAFTSACLAYIVLAFWARPAAWIRGSTSWSWPGHRHHAGRDAQEANVYKLACETADLPGMSGALKREHVVATCDYVKGRFSKDENIVFVHTGGSAPLFSYMPAFAKALAA